MLYNRHIRIKEKTKEQEAHKMTVDQILRVVESSNLRREINRLLGVLNSARGIEGELMLKPLRERGIDA